MSADDKWDEQRIKSAHDPHVHTVDGKQVIARPCPECNHCRCPEHRGNNDQPA